jgi:hypothetical protein
MQDGKQGGITPFQAKGGNHTNLLHVAAINEEQKNWPTVCASEVRQGFQDRSRGMKGSQESLTTAVVKDAANWLTPQSGDVTGSTREAVVMWANGQRPKTSDQRLRTQVAAEQLKHGQAAQASSSLLGSRQGLSEPSQRNWQTFAPGTNNRGMTPHRQVVKALVSGEKAQTQMLTVDQVFAEEIKGTNRQELWLTPRANEPDSDPNFAARNADRGAHCHGTLSSQAKSEEFPTPRTTDWKSTANAPSNPQRVEDGTATLGEFVHAKQWATPRSGKTTDENPETWALRQAKGDVATMPLGAQVKAWATPKASDPQHSGPNMRDSAGNYALPAQAVREQWGTPTARDHKSGRGNEDRQYKELTPMVERTQAGKLNQNWVCCLMGVPMGWVDPMCPVSVIKNWPRFVTGWLRAQTAQIPSGFSEMELSLPLQSERSEFSLAS